MSPLLFFVYEVEGVDEGIYVCNEKVEDGCWTCERRGLCGFDVLSVRVSSLVEWVCHRDVVESTHCPSAEKSRSRDVDAGG